MPRGGPPRLRRPEPRPAQRIAFQRNRAPQPRALALPGGGGRGASPGRERDGLDDGGWRRPRRRQHWRRPLRRHLRPPRRDGQHDGRLPRRAHPGRPHRPQAVRGTDQALPSPGLFRLQRSSCLGQRRGLRTEARRLDKGERPFGRSGLGRRKEVEPAVARVEQSCRDEDGGWLKDLPRGNQAGAQERNGNTVECEDRAKRYHHRRGPGREDREGRRPGRQP
mmetsp:Transcript_11276/g.34399  ORF Transcript_11276/g.34399 Transcript_11276/m.34399 type:complete len:222 (+) Transcript_11276:454-1119(+)